jgi:ABC-type branched-subunit amino acid transport system substrate-binding protein
MLPQEVPNERMKMNKIGFILAVVAVIGGIWFFCDRRDTPASDRPIVKIGLIYPLSGDSAVYGKAAQKAVDMLMEDLRKNNDLKYDYRFVWEDNQLKLATSATAANRLVLMEKTDALVT